MEVSSGEAGGVEAIDSGERGAATEAGRSRGERCLAKADAANGASPPRLPGHKVRHAQCDERGFKCCSWFQFGHVTCGVRATTRRTLKWQRRRRPGWRCAAARSILACSDRRALSADPLRRASPAPAAAIWRDASITDEGATNKYVVGEGDRGCGGRTQSRGEPWIRAQASGASVLSLALRREVSAGGVTRAIRRGAHEMSAPVWKLPGGAVGRQRTRRG